MMKKNEKHSNNPRLVTCVGWFFEFLNNHWIKLFMVLWRIKIKILKLNFNYFKNLKKSMVFISWKNSANSLTFEKKINHNYIPKLVLWIVENWWVSENIFGVITNEVFDLDSKNCLTLLYNPEVSHYGAWNFKFWKLWAINFSKNWQFENNLIPANPLSY
jgi:hypothetical protein